MIITGDHDEKDEKTLKAREELAFLIKKAFDQHSPQIILKRDKEFKLESLMSAIVGQKIYKKIKRKNWHWISYFKRIIRNDKYFKWRRNYRICI